MSQKYEQAAAARDMYLADLAEGTEERNGSVFVLGAPH